MRPNSCSILVSVCTGLPWTKQLALLFRSLVLRTGHWPLETSKIRTRLATSFSRPQWCSNPYIKHWIKTIHFIISKIRGGKGQFGQVSQDIYEPNANEESNAWYITYLYMLFCIQITLPFLIQHPYGHNIWKMWKPVLTAKCCSYSSYFFSHKIKM